MKRFVSRHLSLRRAASDYTYLPLSTSDPQLNLNELAADGKRAPPLLLPAHRRGELYAFEKNPASAPGEQLIFTSSSPRGKNARKRRWFILRRHKKTGIHDSDDGYTTGCGLKKRPIGDDFEVAVEASPASPLKNKKRLNRATKLVAGTPDAETLINNNNTNSSADSLDFGDEQTKLDSATGTTATATIAINKTVAHASFPRDFPCRLERRFAICEELEREIVTEDGTNLRKSRKNLVIRQVLHDLLLL